LAVFRAAEGRRLPTTGAVTAKEFLWKFDEARGWCRSTAQSEPHAIQLSDDKSDARDDVSHTAVSSL